MMVEFKPCPDCGSDEYPKLERMLRFINPMETMTQVKATCPVCEWATLWHKGVKGCASEWNEAKVE